MTLTDFQDLLASTDIKVYHYFANQAPLPYITFFEYAEAGLSADNKRIAECTFVQISYFTTTEHDSNVRVIRQLLNDNEIPYDKKTLLEEDGKRNIIHHIFECDLY